MLTELDTTLRRDPSAPVLLSAKGAVTARAGDITALADGYAAALHRRGLGHGQTLAVAVRPGTRSLALLLAAHRLGLRVAVLDPSAGPEVLLARLAFARPDLVLADAAALAVAGWASRFARRARLALPDLGALGPVATVGPRLPGNPPSLAPQRVLGPLPDRRGDDGDALIVFTSGTTSRPRAVVHTWSSLDACLRSVAALVRPHAGRPVLGGMFFVLVPALASGAPVAPPHPQGAALARQLATISPQASYLTPPQLRSALDAEARFSGTVWTGSAPVSAALLARAKTAGATEAYGVYALTEMIPVAVVDAGAKAVYTGDGDLVGEPAAGVVARVDESGQLLVSGPGAADRYLGEPPTRWIATGDIARIDNGWIVLGGRSKDMILRRAENIYPGLYEPALHVPGVSLALLVGVPTGDADERVVALVEPQPGADPARLREALRMPLRRMGGATPDDVFFATIPLIGRSRKPDRAAAARLAADLSARHHQRGNR